MGVRTPETCWAVNKRQVINSKIDLFEFELEELYFQVTSAYSSTRF